MVIRIFPNDRGTPPGKLAEAEIWFDSEEGALEGLKLVGFGIWERRGGGRNVTFPARTYTVNGDRRSFALLRPGKDMDGQDRIKDLILAAYHKWEVGGEG